MSIFSTNQARHLYVATSFKDPKVLDTDALGAIAVKGDTDKNHLYFEYKGYGGITRSDLIDTKNIISAKATKADKMERELKSVTVTVDSNKLVAGQDYILKIVFRQFAGMSDEDIYTKFGMVHTKANPTASDFYKELALSLAKNFSREATELVSFTLETSEGEPVAVTSLTKDAELTGEYTALVIDEVEQKDWVLGVNPQVPVYFEVQPGVVTVEGDEVIWGKVEETEPSGTVKNGKLIADLEYFCMGERGDQYRNIGWPKVIPTKYMVDPEKEYHVLDIHYAYVGSNESVQKSEKDITIVCSDMATLNSIISKVSTITGKAIAQLS
jgi:hypothetical protein